MKFKSLFKSLSFSFTLCSSVAAYSASKFSPEDIAEAKRILEVVKSNDPSQITADMGPKLLHFVESGIIKVADDGSYGIASDMPAPRSYHDMETSLMWVSVKSEFAKPRKTGSFKLGELAFTIEKSSEGLTILRFTRLPAGCYFKNTLDDGQKDLKAIKASTENRGENYSASYVGRVYPSTKKTPTYHPSNIFPEDLILVTNAGKEIPLGKLLK